LTCNIHNNDSKEADLKFQKKFFITSQLITMVPVTSSELKILLGSVLNLFDNLAKKLKYASSFYEKGEFGK